MGDEEKETTTDTEDEPFKPTAPEKPQATMPREKTSGFAVAALVLGITGLVAVPLIGALLALIFGLLAKGEIKRGKGAVAGSGMATAGIVMGTVGLAIPIILAAVLVPLGVGLIKPELEAAGRILDGAAAARIYYFENEDSYRGMRDTDLADINETVDFRMAPGRTANAVYIARATHRTARLYCYSSRGRRYVISARGDEWRYGSRFWSGRLRWLDDLD